MAKNKQLLNCPPLRFPEFEDEWQQTTLGEIGKYIRGLTYSSDDVTDRIGIAVMRSNNIQDGKKLNYNTEVVYVSILPTDEQWLQKDDVVICAANGSSQLVGKNSYYDGLYKGNITFGAFCGVYRSSVKLTRWLFQTCIYRRYLGLSLQGGNGAIANLKPSDILRQMFSLPSPEEQSKIASFLSLIDERIEAQRQTIEERKKQKKALLNQLFSQSLRFPEFSDSWREHPCLELFNVIIERNKSLKRSLVLSASQSLGMVSRENIGIDIKYKEESLSTYKYINRGDYVIHLRSFQGGFAFSNRDGICSPAYTVLRPTSKLYYGFLSEYFRSSRFINSLTDVTYGIRDGRSISVDEWMTGRISLPSLPEQEKIAKLFTIFDERIEVGEALLKCYETQKRYLLRQMFV